MLPRRSKGPGAPPRGTDPPATVPASEHALAAPAGDPDAVLARRRKPTLPPPGGLLGSLPSASAESTKTSYRTTWEFFVAWCEKNGVQALPASGAVLAEYLVGMREAGYKWATIDRALTTICHAQVLAGHPSPRDDAHVKEAISRLRRAIGDDKEPKAALPLADLERIVAAISGDGLRAKLDRAVLLTGWWGAMRRSEVADLRAEDVEFLPEGIRLKIRHSKTDQLGHGAWIGLPYTQDPAVCPVRAVRAWLDATGIRDGHLFRSVVGRPEKVRGRLDAGGRFVARLVQRLARQVGLDPSRFAGHSLRAGFITEAMEQGRHPIVIARTSRHEGLEIFKRYVRPDDVFKVNAAKGMA